MKMKNTMLLLLTAFIWGTAFVAQSMGMDHMGPFVFNGIRNGIAGVVLLPVIWLLPKIMKEEKKVSVKSGKDLILGGCICGFFLFGGSSLQQVGIQYTTVGKAGFIVTFYIVLVPLFGVFLGKKMGWKIWVSVALAVAGLYFLCLTETFTIGIGDLLSFLSAVAFSFHILAVDHFAPKVDGTKLACIQFFFCGLICVFPAVFTESFHLSMLRDGLIPLLYAAVLSSGVGFTLQIIAQKDVNPAIASLILSLEATFSILAGWVILGERLADREKLGCLLMFAAILLVQLPETDKLLRREEQYDS